MQIMLQRRLKPKTPRRWKIAGVVYDAKSLGVSRVTLWRLLTGRMRNENLQCRYKAMKASQIKPKDNTQPK
jgi:hypothetical protein